MENKFTVLPDKGYVLSNLFMHAICADLIFYTWNIFVYNLEEYKHHLMRVVRDTCAGGH